MSSTSPAASLADAPAEPLKQTPLHALHLELGARMVPFAGYSMPVQFPAGLVAEHKHTRSAAGLFDISHMGQLRLVGDGAAAAFESLVPVDAIDLSVGHQRYGVLTNDEGGVRDDLMFFKEAPDRLFVIVNGACKDADLAHIQVSIGDRCTIEPLFDRALLALQGPQAASTLARLSPGIERFVFMTGGDVQIGGIDAFVTRSGYTGEDGFEISIAAADADRLARLLLEQPDVRSIGLGARNSLRLEAGLCLYGQDLDTTTTPVEAALSWSMQKVRRAGGARAGGFPGADIILSQLAKGSIEDGATKIHPIQRKRVGLIAQQRVPVREGTPLQDGNGSAIGIVTSGLLGPTIDQPIAMGYLAMDHAEIGQRVDAIVRGKPVPMLVSALPFVPARYFRG